MKLSGLFRGLLELKCVPWSARAVARREEASWLAHNAHRRKLALSRLQQDVLFMSEHPVRLVLSLLLLLFALRELASRLPSGWFVPVWAVGWGPAEHLSHFAALWSVQATVAALVYPFVISFIALVLQRRPAAQEILKIYLLDSGAIASGLSSLVLVLVMGVQYLMMSVWGSAFLPAWTTLDTLWFLLNGALTTFFLYRTVEFLRPEVQLQVVERYAVSVALPRDVHRLNLSQMLFVGLDKGWLPVPSFGSDGPPKEPHVLMGPYGFGDGEEQGHVRLLAPARLVDVRIWLLRWVVISWHRQAQRWPLAEKTSSLDRQPSWPRLTLPMSPGSVYAREFPLARVAHGPPLSRWQRQLLRWAVVLRPVAATEKGVQVNAILEELAADARHTAGKGDAEGFGRAYADLTGLHASLLAACLDKTDTGEPGSWAMLKDSGRVFGVPLHQGWYGVYRGIFQSAVTCMALDTTPLRLLCSLSRCLDGDALQASPVEMREELLQLPSALMYQLGLWWAARAEEQGFVDHGHHLGVKLRPPLGGVYEAALSEFVAGWENSRPEGLGRHRQQVPADWGDLRTRARLSAKHIEASARMLLSAVMRGDQAAAEWLADMLSTWWGSHDFHIQPFQLHDTSAFITVEDLLCDWPKLREQLGLDTDGDEDDQRSRPVLQQGVFRAALCNYWTDIRLLCIELMLAWVRAVPVEQAGTSLALDVVCGLLTGKRWRAGGHSFGSFEALSSADYLTAKVRQFAASGEWRGGYLGRLDAFVERAKGLDRPGMISSRIYTFDGADDVESLQESQLELLAVLAEGAWAVPRPVQQQLDRWLDPQVGPYRAVDLMRDRLRSWLERLDQQPGLSGEHIGLLKEKVRPGVTAVDAIGHVKTSLQQMRDAIEGQRAEVLVRQPIDAQRLKQIASFASSTAFNGKEGHFPIHLFAIGHQSEALEEGSLTFTRIRRGELTPLQMEHPASGEDEYFADVMAQHVAMTVLHDVIRQSEVTELEVPDAESYWKVLKAASRDIESPMLLLDNETLPDWVWDWQHPDERSRFKRPDELRVQRREGRGAGYVCDFNDIEVYVAPLPAGQSLLMSKAAFRQLTFTDFGEGRFVKVDVVEPTADKPLVDLRLSYSRKVETVPSRALRLVYAQRS